MSPTASYAARLSSSHSRTLPPSQTSATHASSLTMSLCSGSLAFMVLGPDGSRKGGASKAYTRNSLARLRSMTEAFSRPEALPFWTPRSSRKASPSWKKTSRSRPHPACPSSRPPLPPPLPESAGRGATMAQVSGNAGGYYGCLGAAKGACDNKTLVRRRLAENAILGALGEQLTRAQQIRRVIERVEAEVAKLSEHLPETIRLKESELSAEERRLANFIDFIGEGRGSQALANAVIETRAKGRGSAGRAGGSASEPAEAVPDDARGVDREAPQPREGSP